MFRSACSSVSHSTQAGTPPCAASADAVVVPGARPIPAARSGRKIRTFGTLLAGIGLVTLAACSSLPPVGPGFYRVQRGDTLSRIAQSQGRSTSDLVRWNNITDPNRIELDQVLRVAPPEGDAPAIVSAAPASSSGIRTAPRPARPRPTPAPAAPALPTPAKCGPIGLSWPASGAVLGRFDGNRNKGIDLAGTDGEAVKAAATGQVAFVGQLRGYGNLLIVKHSSGYLTSYAHLQSATVREGQTVNTGQAIALLGHTDASRPLLHFELRCNGLPVDPQRYLSPR